MFIFIFLKKNFPRGFDKIKNKNHFNNCAIILFGVFIIFLNKFSSGHHILILVYLLIENLTDLEIL